MSGELLIGRGRLPAAQGERNAFTLIELLVVIAIIAVLAALLLPTLAAAKQRGISVSCQNNLKQLQLCWHMYPGDFQDYLPPNAYIYTFTSTNTGTHMKQFSWCAGNARVDATTDNIKIGLLWPYNTQTGIYHCPADLSTIEDAAGRKLPQPRNRSYNMSQSVNAYGQLINPSSGQAINNDQPCFEKLGQITNPSPARLFVFIDENEDTLYDAQFGFPQPPFDNEWWDMPADRHYGRGGPGANLSFADGHVEHWKWNVRKDSMWPGQPVKTRPDEYPDYRKVQNAMRVVSEF
jgi:prepilin-type N-terminal cleavage/methylation domain-containing protein/prepilin-type processing-associated H-X9-DG protein